MIEAIYAFNSKHIYHLIKCAGFFVSSTVSNFPLNQSGNQYSLGNLLSD